MGCLSSCVFLIFLFITTVVLAEGDNNPDIYLDVVSTCVIIKEEVGTCNNDGEGKTHVKINGEEKNVNTEPSVKKKYKHVNLYLGFICLFYFLYIFYMMVC